MLGHVARLRAGTATEDITPDGPVAMSGYGAREDPSTGVNDPLSATALVLDDGAVTVALVSLDLLNVSREFTRDIERTLVEQGLDLDELLLIATHTHAGPYVPARALDVSPPLQKDVDVSESVAAVKTGVVQSITSAHQRLESATITIGRASEDEIPVNRRAAGGVGGNVRMPDGPIDPAVTALLVETASGTETIVYNFACHPVCTSAEERLLSADWPGYARQRIEAEREGAHVLFINGAAGDINPHGVDDWHSELGVYEYMDRVGTRIGDTVLEAVENAESDPLGGGSIERSPIRVDSADLRLPVKSTPPAERIRDRIRDLETTLETLENAGDDTGYEAVYWNLRYAEELLAIAEWDAPALPNRLPYVELGDVGVLGLPGEVLVRHGLEFKERARVDTLVLAGYTNDYVGYVPTLADLENIGYEVRTMKIAPEAIVEFREAALDLIGDR